MTQHPRDFPLRNFYFWHLEIQIWGVSLKSSQEIFLASPGRMKRGEPRVPETDPEKVATPSPSSWGKSVRLRGAQ